MKALDLFCGAGGVSAGLHKAGFEVTGVDLSPQKNFPFRFHQADALTFPLEGYDLIWASPPCQAHTALKTMPNSKQHLDLIPATRARLEAWAKETGGIYIIENVPGAPLRVDVLLCGTMFGLGTKDGRAELRRHRWFESNFRFELPPPCQHNLEVICNAGDGTPMGMRRPMAKTVAVYGKPGGSSVRAGITQHNMQQRREAMDIYWMNREELSQAIPPAYSYWLARQIFTSLNRKESA